MKVIRREQLATKPSLLGPSVQECPTSKATRGRGPVSISQYSGLTLNLIKSDTFVCVEKPPAPHHGFCRLSSLLDFCHSWEYLWPIISPEVNVSAMKENKWITRLEVLNWAFLFSLFWVGTASAEFRTITATGEYRMGDNDTRMDAKRLALLDAKRLALEQAGTYVESITEVKNFNLTNEEIRAYTAGIVEVMEQATRTTMEGETTVVRADVTTKIDTDTVSRQIDALRKNEGIKNELVRLKVEGEQLQQQVEIKTRELAALRSKTDVEAVTQQRQTLIVQATVSDLLGKAETAFIDSYSSLGQNLIKKQPAYDKPTVDALARARNYAEQALALDPLSVRVKEVMAKILNGEGMLLDDNGEHAAAADKVRLAINLHPNYAFYHWNLASVLLHDGDIKSALAESRTAQRLQPNNWLYDYEVGTALAFSGDVNGAVTAFRNMGCPVGHDEPYEPYERYYCSGSIIKGLINEVGEAPTMSKVREKLPKKKLKEAATKELREYLRLVPNTSKNQYGIIGARATLLELEK